MFNTLKELKESLPLEDLHKYSKELVGKAPEEIKTVLKLHDIEVSDQAASECYGYLNAEKTMSDQELENVTGGGCTSYSSCTYAQLGLAPSVAFNQKPEYHPVITTMLNHCSLGIHSVNCGGCYLCEGIGLVSYCTARSEERDDA